MGKMRELQMARKAANVLAIPVPKHIRRQEAKRLLAISERLRREIGSACKGAIGSVEPDPDVRAICPVIAHKLFGKSGPDGLTAAQRRQVCNFARDVIKALRLSRST